MEVITVGCNTKYPGQVEHEQNLNNLFVQWESDRLVRARFSDKINGYDQEMSARNMQWFLSQRLGLPVGSDLKLANKEIRRASTEIKDFSQRLRGKYSNLAWVVPEGTSKQDPTSRKFYNELGGILNFERINMNRTLDVGSFIANKFYDAYASIGLDGKKALAKIKIERERVASEEGINFAEFVGQMEQFLVKDEGKLMGQFHNLVELKNIDFKKSESDFVNVDGEKETVNPYIYQAAKRTRSYLNKLGDIYLYGLQDLRSLAALRYANTSDIKKARVASRRFKDFDDKIVNAIKNIKDNKKEGGYYPHLTYETLANVKERLSNAMSRGGEASKVDFTDISKLILDSSIVKDLPERTKSRNKYIEDYWVKDPLFVLDEYSAQSTGFNKLVRTQAVYMEAIKNMPKDHNLEYINGVKRFIEEEYAVFTRGLGERPEWANNAVLTANAFQTATKMGLNITGAVKNAASAIHYYSRVGFGQLGKTMRAMTDQDFSQLMYNVEKDAGFLFSEVSPELYTEGTFLKGDFDQSKVSYNPVTGKVTYNREPFKDFLKRTGQWTINKSLWFHRFTENSQRKWMYRTAFHKKYLQLLDRGYKESAAIGFAKKNALEMVNAWAYEYAVHAKAKVMRGEWRTVDEMEGQVISKKYKSGAVGAALEASMHLMHYPLSLFESHWGTLKGAHKAALSRQFDSDELQHLIRFGAASAFLSLSSVLINANLFNIFENESQERIQRAVSDVSEHDDPTKSTFGLLSEVAGTNVGTLKFLMISSGLIDMDHSDLNKIILGNVDYSDNKDKNVERYKSYQLATVWGMLKHKIAPSIKEGRPMDMFRHIFKFYPEEWTKRYHEKIFGKKKKEKKRKMNSSLYASLDMISKIAQKGGY